MPMTRKYNTDATKITDQLKVSIAQGLTQALGAGNLVKITSVTFKEDALEPQGRQFVINVTADIYPDERKTTPS